MDVDTPNKAVPSSSLAIQTCSECWKIATKCLCAEIIPLQPRTRLLILQHPQEVTSPLGSARLLSLSVPECTHRVGLSWRSLSQAFGEECNARDWAVLFLGALKESQDLDPEVPFQVLQKGGRQVPASAIKGIVLLDGNWSQSKTLWWRNPWMLKLNRMVLNPALPSRYGAVRKQPRKNCLSTMEAAAESFRGLGEDQIIPVTLHALFEKHVALH